MRTTIIASTIFFSAAIACGGIAPSAPDSGTNDAGPDQPDATPTPDASAPDVDNGAPSSTYPAFTIDAPQVVSFGGPTLAAPKLVPVYFANDDTEFTSQLTTFMNKLGTSAFWLPAVTEYGVGAISCATPVQLTDNAPASIDDADIQPWIASKIDDGTLPPPDANTIYAIYYPDGTTVTLGNNGTSCQDFGAYHDNITYKTGDVSYAVMPRCSGWGSSVLDATTASASHEFIEASTDPYPQTDSAYGQVDDNHILWEYVLGGGETGDMCAQFSASYVTPPDLGFSVQRSWSNAAAKAGHDPCQPADKSPYFNSMPVLTDSISLGGQGSTKGVHIPIGSSGTIEVDLFSDAPTSGPWTVSATDTSGAGSITFAWDRTTGQNGEKLHLTINAVKKTQYGAAGFTIKSKLNGRTTSWFGLVGN
jgi:hypothetical protein